MATGTATTVKTDYRQLVTNFAEQELAQLGKLGNWAVKHPVQAGAGALAVTIAFMYTPSVLFSLGSFALGRYVVPQQKQDAAAPAAAKTSSAVTGNLYPAAPKPASTVQQPTEGKSTATSSSSATAPSSEPAPVMESKALVLARDTLAGLENITDYDQEGKNLLVTELMDNATEEAVIQLYKAYLTGNA